MMVGMGRQLRIDAPGCWHHVMNRGAGRRIVFRDDGERQLFVDLLAQLDDRFGVEVHAFCLMGNHYHAVLRSGSGRLSEAMAWLGARFTLTVNSDRDVDGAIFRGRFHSVLVERDEHLDWLHRYVNSNPAELGWSAPFAEYPWSGLATTLGRRADQAWLRTDYYRSRFDVGGLRLESAVEDARMPERAVLLPASLITTDEVIGAVALASGPGPYVNTAAQQRTAHAVIAHRHDLADPPAVASLERASAKAYLRRCRAAVGTDDELAGLIRRVESILALSTDRRRSCA